MKSNLRRSLKDDLRENCTCKLATILIINYVANNRIANEGREKRRNFVETGESKDPRITNDCFQKNCVCVRDFLALEKIMFERGVT